MGPDAGNREERMISDTLSSAAKEVRNYLRDQPEVYAGTRQRLEQLVNEMDEVRSILDMSPGLQTLSNPASPSTENESPSLMPNR
jgi:hypothetical protein